MPPQKVFHKKVHLRILQYWQENTCLGVSFLIKLQALVSNFIKKKFLRTPILKNICEQLLLD